MTAVSLISGPSYLFKLDEQHIRHFNEVGSKKKKEIYTKARQLYLRIYKEYCRFQRKKNVLGDRFTIY